MFEDLRYAIRTLRHRWQPAATAVLCLGLGIGVNVTLFAVIDALLFRPPAGVARADEVVRVRLGDPAVTNRMGSGPAITYPQMRAIAEQMGTVAAVAGYAPRRVVLGSGEDSELVDVVLATRSYFDVLRVRPHRGRLPDAAESDTRGAAPVAVLSHAAWQRRFAAASGTVGSVIELNGVAVTIIGVASPGFAGVDLGEPELWLNLGASSHPAFGGASLFSDRAYWLQVLARPQAGVSDGGFEQALTSVRAPDGGVRLALHALPLRAMFFADQRGENPVPVWTLGITLAVLLLSCATVANLLLTQGVAREHELAMRMTLGATRGRILRQLLLENMIIAVCGALGALLLASWSSQLVRLLPIPAIPDLVGLRAGSFAFAVAAGATLLFGVLPALRATRSSQALQLRRATTGGSREPVRLQNALMSVQIAFSFVLLVSAGLFLASFRNVTRIDTGFALDRVLEVGIDFAGRGLSDDEVHRLVSAAVERATDVPGITAAATGGIIPFYMFSRGAFAIRDGRTEDEQPLSEYIDRVGVDYFGALGIRIEDGRAFTNADLGGGEGAAVVSAEMARRHWPDGSAVGSCIQLGRDGDHCMRIVGVTADLRYHDLRGERTAVLFILDRPGERPTPIRRATLFVNAADPHRIAEPLRRRIQSLHAGMPLVTVTPLDHRARPSRIPWEVGATLFTAFGLLAAVLAAVGLYMVIAFLVTQRHRELGIRSALGSTGGALVALVMGHALRVSGFGIAAGLVGAGAVTQLLTNRLYGVTPAEPTVWAAAAGLLLTVALLASWLPARRAARLDPLVVMRQE